MPPTSQERQQTHRPPNPGDATSDLIRRMRDGDDSEILTEEDEASLAEDEVDLEQLHKTAAAQRGEEAAAMTPQPAKLPSALANVIGTEAEGELMAVAKFLDSRGKKKLTLVFHTPIGDVKCPVNWSSTDPAQLHLNQHMLLILVRSSDSMFVPKPGSELSISFAEYPNSPHLAVMCLAPPMRLYPGVGIDLLCFLPQNSSMEKNGKLKEDAPSVVSGKPSNGVDETGEPVAEGEKSANWKDAPPVVGRPAESATTDEADPSRDFDKPRAS